MKKKSLQTIGFWSIVLLLSIALGVWMSAPGLLVWDDLALYRHSVWTLKLYSLREVSVHMGARSIWIAVLWPFILGFATEIIFPWLRDPYLVRHALTIALFPLFFVWLWKWLRRNNVQRTAALLIVAMLMGHIRLWGNALVSLRDFPHAIGFLTSIILSWKILENIRTKPKNNSSFIALGAVSVLPFLLRSPNIMPLPIVMIALGYILKNHTSFSTREKWISFLKTGCTACAILFFASPALWFTPEKILYPLELFSNFPWEGSVRIFGQSLDKTNLPLWYYPAWLVVGAEPITFMMTIIGIIIVTTSVIRKQIQEKTWWSYDFEYWLGLIVLLSWMAVLILRPEDYDEDRHLLFLFPPIILLAGFGLKKIPTRLQAGIASVILFFVCLNYVSWGVYAYAYKSPLVSRYAHDYMGDFRGVCMNAAAHAVSGLVPQDALIQAWGIPTQEIEAQAHRLHNSRIAKDTSYVVPTFSLQKGIPDYFLISNRDGLIEKAFMGSDFANAKIIKRFTMPPYNEDACVIIDMQRNATK